MESYTVTIQDNLLIS